MARYAALLVLLCASCGRLNQLSAPAPDGALQCAIREAEARGYTRVGGSERSGSVRVSQVLRSPQATAPPADPADDARRSPDAEPERQLLIRYEGGVLHIQPLEPGESGSRAETPGFAADHAAEILTECGAPA